MQNKLTQASLTDILTYLKIEDEFEKPTNITKFPFNQERSLVEFETGTIIFPINIIDQVIYNRIKNNESTFNQELKFIYSIPFKYDKYIGTIHKDIKLPFNYDKQKSYGKINKSIEETCYFIQRNAKESSYFYILDEYNIIKFFSDFIITNQSGLGNLTISSSLMTTI